MRRGRLVRRTILLFLFLVIEIVVGLICLIIQGVEKGDKLLEKILALRARTGLSPSKRSFQHAVDVCSNTAKNAANVFAE